MMISKRSSRVVAILLAISALILLGVAVRARRVVIGTAAQQKDKRGLQPGDPLTSVVSDIANLEVISAFIDSEGLANITIANHSSKSIIGLGVSSGKLTFTDDNGIAQDNPKPLVGPYGSYTLQIIASNLHPNQPIHVSAVLYDDGSEEGNEAQRKNIHDERNRQKEQRSREGKAKP